VDDRGQPRPATPPQSSESASIIVWVLSAVAVS
jgi:hypothetical protein